MPKGHGHVVENVLLIVLAIFLPPCAVACVTGCDINFVLNLIFTLFLTYLGGIVHAICVVVIYGFREKEMPRARRQARLRAKGEGVAYDEPAPPAPLYHTKSAPANVTRARDGARAENAYVAGSVDTIRGAEGDLDAHPPGEAAPGGTAYGEAPVVNARDFGEDRKMM